MSCRGWALQMAHTCKWLCTYHKVLIRLKQECQWILLNVQLCSEWASWIRNLIIWKQLKMNVDLYGTWLNTVSGPHVKKKMSMWTSIYASNRQRIKIRLVAGRRFKYSLMKMATVPSHPSSSCRCLLYWYLSFPFWSYSRDRWTWTSGSWLRRCIHKKHMASGCVLFYGQPSPWNCFRPCEL